MNAKFKTPNEAEIFRAKTFEEATNLINTYIEQKIKEVEAIEAALPFIKSVHSTVKSQVKVTKNEIEKFSNLLKIVTLAAASKNISELLTKAVKFLGVATSADSTERTVGLNVTDWENLVEEYAIINKFIEEHEELARFKRLYQKEDSVYDDDDNDDNDDDDDDDDTI